MKQKLKRLIKNSLVNAPGWKTKRRIVVIESDDWGAIRLPEKKTLNQLRDYGVNTQSDHYIRNDALASETDLTQLFDLLGSFQSKNDKFKAPSITANVIMCNPDFDKIREDNYKIYHFELFTDTLKKYPEHKNSFGLWKNGIESGLFHPQFHGREHLHVNRWLKGLKKKNSETAKAFDMNVYALCTSSTSEKRKSYLAACEWDDPKDRDFNLHAVEDGLYLFKKLFGFSSLSSIAPNYTWNSDVENVLREGGVRFLQGASVQRTPEIGRTTNKTVRHYTGQQNTLGQTYLVRNCRFEPASDPGKDWVNSCLGEIKNAFFWNKPAIIESHRVNFIGYINPENRDRNLKLFEQLLNQIVRLWPEVEFMSSDELGKVIEAGRKEQ